MASQLVPAAAVAVIGDDPTDSAKTRGIVRSIAPGDAVCEAVA